MSWSSNISSIVASLEAEAAKIDAKTELAANQALVLGLNEIHIRCPIDTGNLNSGYDRDSNVEKPAEGVRQVTWTSVAMNDDYNYQPINESRTPHLSPGVAAALPEIISNTKEVMGQ